MIGRKRKEWKKGEERRKGEVDKKEKEKEENEGENEEEDGDKEKTKEVRNSR